MAALGVIAGGGALPSILAQTALQQGRDVYVVCLDGADLSGVAVSGQVALSIGRLEAMRDYFKANGVSEIVTVGQQTRPDFATLETDAGGVEVLENILAQNARGDDVLFRAITDYFAAHDLALIPVERVLVELVAPEGWLCQPQDADKHNADIAQAVRVARLIGAEDIGQGAVVCRGQVLAVEGPEGTDAMLARIADLPPQFRGTADARAGVLAKMPKPNQIREVDLPTVGLKTVQGVAAIGLAGVVFEAGGALLVERERCIEFAKAHGLFLLGLSP